MVVWNFYALYLDSKSSGKFFFCWADQRTYSARLRPDLYAGLCLTTSHSHSCDICSLQHWIVQSSIFRKKMETTKSVNAYHSIIQVSKSKVKSRHIIQNFWWYVCLNFVFEDAGSFTISSESSLKSMKQISKLALPVGRHYSNSLRFPSCMSITHLIDWTRR